MTSQKPKQPQTIPQTPACLDEDDPRNIQDTINLLLSWREGDPEEQRVTWEYLQRALDEDR